MTVIRVVTDELRSSSNTVQEVGANVLGCGRNLLNDAQGLPSYDGQFAPVVASICGGAFARSQSLRSSLGEMGERLNGIALAFEEADSVSVTGFQNTSIEFFYLEGVSNFLVSFTEWLKYALGIKKFLQLSCFTNIASIFGTIVPFVQIPPFGLLLRKYSFRGLKLPWHTPYPNIQPSLAPVVIKTTPQAKSKFGDLLEKARKEHQQKHNDEIEIRSTQELGKLQDEKLANYRAEYGYNVPVKHQGSLGGGAACLLTSASMVTDFYHQQDANLGTMSPQEYYSILDEGDFKDGRGMSPAKLTDELNDLGYQNVSVEATGNWEVLGSRLKNGPVIAQVKLDTKLNQLSDEGNVVHAVVVTGISPDGYHVNVIDPWVGKSFEMTKDDFDAAWRAVSDPKGSYSRPLYIIRP